MYFLTILTFVYVYRFLFFVFFYSLVSTSHILTLGSKVLFEPLLFRGSTEHLKTKDRGKTLSLRLLAAAKPESTELPLVVNVE